MIEWKDWLQIFGAVTLITFLAFGAIYLTSEPSPFSKDCRFHLVEAMAFNLGSIPMVVVFDADRACLELEALQRRGPEPEKEEVRK